jgi:hypothetical protein
MIAGIRIPDSRMARAAEDLIRQFEPPTLFNHSVRVFVFGALAGTRLRLKYDPELLYVGALFHDLGLMKDFESKTERFEIDGANAARAFLRDHGITPAQTDLVWEAIALHTTPGIPLHMRPEIALTRLGVRTDVVGADFSDFTQEQRDAIIAAYPRGDFKNEFIAAQARSARAKPETTFGTINSDYLEWTDPSFTRPNQCRNILNAPWAT